MGALFSAHRTDNFRQHSDFRQHPNFRFDQDLLFKEVQVPERRNIVIFGETGVGKSSLINLLSENGNEALVSNRAVGGTFGSCPHEITIHGMKYTFWDTAGLNEGDAGSVPADAAFERLHDLVGKLSESGGLSLLVYWIRGARFRDIIKTNYDLFVRIICQGQIPTVLVITGLENEEPMEAWWTANEKDFSRNMFLAGHACVTTSRGRNSLYDVQYGQSRDKARALIRDLCPPSAWAVDDGDKWFEQAVLQIRRYGRMSIKSK